MSASANYLFFDSSDEYGEEQLNYKLHDLQENRPQDGFTQAGIYSNFYSGLPAENQGVANVSVGITKGIVFPLWVYLAGGVSCMQPLYGDAGDGE